MVVEKVKSRHLEFEKLNIECHLLNLVTLNSSKGFLYICIADRIVGLRRAQHRTNRNSNLTTL